MDHAREGHIVAVFSPAQHLVPHIGAEGPLPHPEAFSPLQGGVHGPLPPQDGPGQGDALYDLLVPGAAAHIAPNGLLDLILGGIGILVQKGLAREDHTRDTKAALHRPHRAESVDKGLLLGLGEPLYGEDVLSHRLFCGQDTGPHGLSVHHDGTGAACPLAASVLHGGEMQVVPQIAQQRLLLLGLPEDAVYRKGVRFTHVWSPYSAISDRFVPSVPSHRTLSPPRRRV